MRKLVNPFVLNRASGRSLIPTFEMGESIPKVIHQTYHARPWARELERNAAHLSEMNPTWEYRFHDYDDRRAFILATYGSRVLALYDSINERYGAARADLFRYLLLYKVGGLYIDMKSSVRLMLDDVIRADDKFLLSHWRSGDDDLFANWGRHKEVSHLKFGEYQQWFIFCVAGHPFLKAVIDTVLRNIEVYSKTLHGSGAYAVFRVTGPVPYTLAIEPILQNHPHRIVNSQTDLGLIYSIFDSGGERTHEKIFPHYSTVTEPLITMGVGRASLDRMAGSFKALAKLALSKLRTRHDGDRG